MSLTFRKTNVGRDWSPAPVTFSLFGSDYPPVFTEYSLTLAIVQNTEVIKDLGPPLKELTKY